MSEYIVGLKEYGELIVEDDKELRKGLAPTDRNLPFLDFRQYPFAGAEALDKHTLQHPPEGQVSAVQVLARDDVLLARCRGRPRSSTRSPGMAEKNLTLNYWPVGTGPYMLTEYMENRRHVLERNPNFRGEPYPCEGEPGDREKG